MTAEPPSLARDIAAAMDWWRDAGVDMDFSDDVTAWLSDEEPSQIVADDQPSSEAPRDTAASASLQNPAPSPQKIERIDLLGESPPNTLEEFRKFWLEAPGLDTRGPKGRIPPRGPANARLMILVVDPEEVDSDQLISGPQGQLLSRMLTAMGVSENETYFAAALPRHTPMADTVGIASAGMDAVLAHHIKLAAPQSIVAFGANILPLLGHDQAQDMRALRKVNHDSATIPLMVSEGLDSMMSMPRLKARFWRRWMEWSLGQ